MLPDTIPLSEEHFKTFLEKTVITPHSRRILGELTAKKTVTAPQNGEETAAKPAAAPAAKPVQTVNQNGARRPADEGNGTRVTG
jgi:hypothetical protein